MELIPTMLELGVRCQALGPMLCISVKLASCSMMPMWQCTQVTPDPEWCLSVSFDMRLKLKVLLSFKSPAIVGTQTSGLQLPTFDLKFHAEHILPS